MCDPNVLRTTARCECILRSIVHYARPATQLIRIAVYVCIGKSQIPLNQLALLFEMVDAVWAKLRVTIE